MFDRFFAHLQLLMLVNTEIRFKSVNIKWLALLSMINSEKGHYKIQINSAGIPKRETTYWVLKIFRHEKTSALFHHGNSRKINRKLNY